MVVILYQMQIFNQEIMAMGAIPKESAHLNKGLSVELAPLGKTPRSLP